MFISIKAEDGVYHTKLRSDVAIGHPVKRNFFINMSNILDGRFDTASDFILKEHNKHYKTSAEKIYMIILDMVDQTIHKFFFLENGLKEYQRIKNDINKNTVQ